MDRPAQLSQDTDLPLSQETFKMLWDQLQDNATQGIVLQEPVQVDLANYALDEGDAVIQQNQVEFQVEQLQMEPQLPMMSEFPSLRSDSSFLAQLNSQLPPQLPPQLNHDLSPDSGNMPSSTGYASATDTTTTPPPPAYTPPLSLPGQPQNILPSNTEYPGDYDFQINLGAPTSQATKSVSWTYSPSLKKLFVDRDKPCPIQFKTSAPPPPNCYIRVLPIFKQAENLAEVVARCPNHVGLLDGSDISANHLVLCSDPSTQYYTEPNTGRHSLCVPYIMPQVGTEYTKFLFIFKCFISCVGGLNRRRIQLVFTLEDETGHVLGRQILDARVCACPGRDRKTEERSVEKAKTPQKKTLKRGASKVTSSVGLTSFTKKKKQDDEIFHIMVQGREKYELLMKVKESLDLMDLVTPQQMTQYRQQQTTLNQQVQMANGTPNLARVSSIQSTPPSTSNAIQHSPPPSMARSQSYPTQASQPQLQPPQQQLQHQQQQQQQPQAQLQPPQQQFNQQQQQQPQGNMGMNHQYTNLNNFPSTSIPNLQHLDNRRCKDESDGPNLSMEVDAIPTSQGFGLPNTQLTPPVNQSQQDHSIFNWLSRLGLKEYTDVFQQKGIHSVTQLDEICMEDLAHIPHQPREALWKGINETRHGLQLDRGPGPSLYRTSSSASTASIHSSGGTGGSQVYRATRFTLKQTLSFKVEKEDGYDDCSH